MHQLEEAARAVCKANDLNFVEYRASGTFKETYHAKLSNGASVAVKIFRPDHPITERNQREVDAMVRCAHTNVAKLFFIGSLVLEARRFSYSIEEYLPGGTLGTRLSANANLSLAEVLSLGSQLISAVSHIAAQDVVHRDIKPENVMYRGDATQAVIVDFGLVRDLAKPSLTAPWAQMGPGSPFYAAPEQLNNEIRLIDWRTDQFALGVLLAISLYERHPYACSRNTSMAEVINAVATRKGPATEFIASTKKDGISVLQTMVAPWPIQRYRSPRQLADAWDRLTSIM